MIPNNDAVDELRRLFFDKFKNEYNSSLDLFYQADVDRVRNSDAWLIRFLNHHEGDMKEAFRMLWDTCEWRKSMKVNEINEYNVCIDYLKDGSLFPYGWDKDEKVMLVFRCKMHYKGQKNFDELKRCLIYWFERLERQTNGDQITIFFDMTDTGLINMDMEFTKYLISLNKLYYPSFLNYILIYEMPWVLNAAFKIIKSWLPARAVQKIKFLGRANIKEFVNAKKMMTHWGGEDEYTFTFTPEVRIELPVSNKAEETRKKTVHFALNQSSPESSPVSTSFRDMKAEDSPTSSACLVKLRHPDTMQFNWNGAEFVGSVNVENVSGKNVLYKIKTTSPDRYRVKPNAGILQPGISVNIAVVLQYGYHIQSILKDKFLLMATVTETEEANAAEVAEMWKFSENIKVEQHRLKCSIVEQSHSLSPQNCTAKAIIPASDDIVEKVEQLKTVVYQMCDYNKKVHKDLSRRQNVITVILITLVLFIILLLFFVWKNPSIFEQRSASCSASNSKRNYDRDF